MRRWAGLAVLLVGASCRRSLPATGSDAAVRAVIDGYLTALAAKPVNVDSLATFFHPNAEILEPGVVALQGTNRVRFYLESFADVTVEKVGFQVDTVEIHAATAYVWGFLTQSLRHGDSTTTSRARAVWVLQQDSTATWRIRRTLTQPVGN